MTVSSIVDDVSNTKHLAPVLAMAASERELSVDWLWQLACGRASTTDPELLEHFTTTLIDYLERAGVGRLERRADGRVVFVFADELPTTEEAWQRAWDTAADEEPLSERG